MNNLWTKLKIPKVRVIEVGAAEIDDRHFCEDLLKQDGIDYIGFEPNEQECEKLNTNSKFKYLPRFIGDGSAETFYECRFPASSSIFQPNIPLLSKFQRLAEAHTVEKTRHIFTHCLDGIDECKDADFLKMDVQGAELKVMQGAGEVLKSVTVVQTEVMFLEMYLFQPLFGEIDWYLRKHGFTLHRFLGGPDFGGTAFKPTHNVEEPHRPISQAI
jgi:FkbM family methyltransferase